MIALPSQRRRGPTRNLQLSRKRGHEQNLSIEVNDNMRRIVGKDSQHFITESGCVVRKIAKLNVEKWSQLVPQDREDMYNTVTVNITLSLNLLFSCIL